MDSVLLGKTVRAMYKLSGKTLQQLSDETGLTPDTINNLFYARLQKPGYFGVSAFVRACGFTAGELEGFLKEADKLPAGADVTEAFTKYIETVRDTEVSAAPANLCKTNSESCTDCREQTRRQLDELNKTHLHYAEELAAGCDEEIKRMEESGKKLKEHFDHSVAEVKKAHERELRHRDEEIRRLNRLCLILTILLFVSFAVFIFLLKK